VRYTGRCLRPSCTLKGSFAVSAVGLDNFPSSGMIFGFVLLAMLAGLHSGSFSQQQMPRMDGGLCFLSTIAAHFPNLHVTYPNPLSSFFSFYHRKAIPSSLSLVIPFCQCVAIFPHC